MSREGVTLVACLNCSRGLEPSWVWCPWCGFIQDERLTDPAPAPRCDGSPGDPGWSLTPTGCVRFDNDGQMTRCPGCPSCQGRK